MFAPTREEAAAELQISQTSQARMLLQPPRNKGRGYKSTGLDAPGQTRPEGVRMFIQ